MSTHQARHSRDGLHLMPVVLTLSVLAPHASAQGLPAPPASPAPVVSYEYDAQSNQTKIRLAPGVSGYNFVTQSSYDSLNRRKTVTDAKSGLTQIGYDAMSRNTSVSDPRSLLTQYPRNGLGDVTSLISPDTGTATHTYDAAGNITTRTDSRGVLATHAYDALNRLIGVVFSKSGQASLTYSWTYDETGTGFSNGIGRLTSTSHPNGATRYAYDPQGSLLTETQTVNAQSGANASAVITPVSYGYDAAGHMTSITYPSGRVLTIAYSGGLATTITLAKDASSAASTLLDQIGYSPFGGLLSWNWQMSGGAQANVRVYDTSGRLVRYRLGNTVRDLTYDAADRIVSYTHYDASTGTASPSLDQSFSYDELGRLTSISAGGNSWTITYDANGNRTGVTFNGTSSAYTTSATSNRLNAITNPARSFAYDSAGNTTSDSASYSSTYDLSGRLATLTAGGATATFSYDAFGRRVRKFSTSGASSTVLFVYDQGGQLLGEYDGSGQAIREYVWLGSAPLAVFTPDPANGANPPVVYYIHSDHLNTPRMIVDGNNAIRWRWLAEPFGTTAPETDPSGLGVFAQNLRFPGQYADTETDLFYNMARDYKGEVGRYVQSDPIGLAGGINTYAYVEGNPISAVDADGLQRRVITVPPSSYTATISAAQVSSLVTQIRRYDANFNYATIAPRGYRYNERDVEFLRDLLRQYEESAVCTANGLPRPRIDYGSTPNGIPFTRHYGTETGPVRNMPGSVIDNAIANGVPRFNPRDGTTSYYDAINNVTVVVGRDGVVSSRIGNPTR